jgi:endonuclease/exonuclease/phosphatase (EEP) superfamily protein YafD
MEAIGVTSRDDWGADSTTCSTTEDDWYRMAIHHTAGGETYGGTVEGAVQALQAYAMGSDYCDIPYQYLVGYDGSLWEGRELTYQSGATGGGNNDGNIAVCFLGCFDSGGCGSSYDTPPDTMIVSARLLIQTLAAEHSFVTDDDTMKGHRDWPGNSTACPGDLVYARLDELRETGAPFQASVVSASFSEGVPVLLHPGEEVSLSVDLRNDGTETWTSNTSLAPWPRDAASPLANETWVSTTRVAHPAADVAPGETGAFTFTVRGGEVGELSLPLALVEDGVTWFADIPWGGGPADGFLTLTVQVEAEESDGGGTDGGSDGATDGGADGATDGGDGGGLDTDAAGEGGGLEGPRDGEPPGAAVSLADTGKGGCQVAPIGSSLGLALSALLALGRRRRPSIGLLSLSLLVGCGAADPGVKRQGHGPGIDGGGGDGGGGDTAPQDSGEAGPNLSTDQAEYEVGERLMVAFAGASGAATDWVGLYPADQTENQGSAAWLYTNGSQSAGEGGPVGGRLRFLPVGLPAGDWEARLFFADGYEVMARAPFRVTDPGERVPPAAVGDLTVMTFNSWLDGSAVPGGVDKIAAAIVACDPDLVALQEGGPAFAAELLAAVVALSPAWAGAMTVDDGSDNVLLSRFPLSGAVGDPGGYSLLATLSLPDRGDITVVGTHFDYTEYGPYLARDGASVEEIEHTEGRVRGDDAAAVLGLLEGLDTAIVLGDHNAPSHLDWTADNADQNFDLVVAWPSSVAFAEGGFVDAYRAVHPDPTLDRGLTWTAGYPKGSFEADDVHDRIDFVYGRDGALHLTPLDAYVYDADPWPSDHRAVVVSYQVD